jgi:hypothetical protein
LFWNVVEMWNNAFTFYAEEVRDMPTRLEIPFDRAFTDAATNEIIARAMVTLNMFQQLGADYQSLPGFGVGQYQTDTDALQADIKSLEGLLNQMVPLLQSIDAKAGPLDAKNKGALRMLQGMLAGKPETVWLDRITGPTPRRDNGGTPQDKTVIPRT